MKAQDSADTANTPLALRPAILQWCDAQRVAAFQDLHERMARLPPLPARPSWFEDARGFRDDTAHYDAENRARSQLQAALAAAMRDLELDFKTRVEMGELCLTGVQVVPVALTDATVIPGAWAFELELDVARNAVTFQGRRFASVRVKRVDRDSRTPPCAAADELQVANVAKDTDGARAGRAPGASNRMGRPAFDWDKLIPLIVARLDRIDSGTPRKALIPEIRDELTAQFQDVRAPAESTIRDHWPRLVAKARGQTQKS